MAGIDALLAARSGPGAAPMLLATAVIDLGLVSGQRNFTAIIDGSSIAVTCIAPPSYVATAGDRVLLTRAGSAMYLVQILQAPGNFAFQGNLTRRAPSILDAASGSGLSPITSTATAVVTLGAMPFTGYALVVGVFDLSVTATGAGTVVGELFNTNTTVTESQQLLCDTKVIHRQTVSQAWAVAVTQGDVLQLMARITSTGTASLTGQHTGLSAVCI